MKKNKTEDINTLHYYNPIEELKDAKEQTPAMPIEEILRINDIMEKFEKEVSIRESDAELKAQTITIGGFKA